MSKHSCIFHDFTNEKPALRVELLYCLLKCEHWAKVQLTDNLSSVVATCTALVNDYYILRKGVECSKVIFECLPPAYLEILSMLVLIRTGESSQSGTRYLEVTSCFQMSHSKTPFRWSKNLGLKHVDLSLLKASYHSCKSGYELTGLWHQRPDAANYKHRGKP